MHFIFSQPIYLLKKKQIETKTVIDFDVTNCHILTRLVFYRFDLFFCDAIIDINKFSQRFLAWHRIILRLNLQLIIPRVNAYVRRIYMEKRCIPYSSICLNAHTICMCVYILNMLINVR